MRLALIVSVSEKYVKTDSVWCLVARGERRFSFTNLVCILSVWFIVVHDLSVGNRVAFQSPPIMPWQWGASVLLMADLAIWLYIWFRSSTLEGQT